MATVETGLLAWLTGAIPATITLLYLIGRTDRRYHYVGRHRAGERPPTPALELDDTQEIPVPYLDPDVGAYRHTLGTRRYELLKSRVLEAKAHMDRRTLQLRTSPYGTPETPDVWADDRELAGVAR